MRRGRLLTGTVIIAALVAAAILGFVAGAASEQDKGAVTCGEGGTVLKVQSTGFVRPGTGTRTLTIGDCEHIDEEAFIAAVEALAGIPTTTTTTTTATTPNGDEATGSVATTTEP